MATVAHHIYSHYNSPQKPNGEQAEDEHVVEQELDPWLTESAFGVNHRLKAAPRFVPAIVSYDEVNNMIGTASSSTHFAEESSAFSQVSDWYKSLPRSSTVPVTHAQKDTPLDPERQREARQSLVPPTESRTRNNWFASNPLPSESSTSTPTLADILAREPPPERKDQPFVPPIFLHIGPSNRGFAMLQQSGWSEGEALGANAPRRTAEQKAREKESAESSSSGKKPSVRIEEREVALDDDGDIVEVQRFEVLDLTTSDSDGEELDGVRSSSSDIVSEPFTSHIHAASGSHNPVALLTPIATVLKSDRLGIGLKAKKVGPYRESKKRVTHSQAAVAAHVRANEEMRMKKTIVGRGAKSFARIARADEESRRLLLASLNAD